MNWFKHAPSLSEQIQYFLDGQVDPQDIPSIQVEQQNDVHVKHLFEEYQKVKLLLRIVPFSPVPRSFVLTPQMVTWKPPKTRMTLTLQKAASFALVFFGILAVSQLAIDFTTIQDRSLASAPAMEIQAEPMALSASAQAGEASPLAVQAEPQLLAEAPAADAMSSPADSNSALPEVPAAAMKSVSEQNTQEILPIPIMSLSQWVLVVVGVVTILLLLGSEASLIRTKNKWRKRNHV